MRGSRCIGSGISVREVRHGQHGQEHVCLNPINPKFLIHTCKFKVFSVEVQLPARLDFSGPVTASFADMEVRKVWLVNIC